MVYEDAEKLYAEVRKDGQDLLEEATLVLLPKSVPMTATSLAKGNNDIIGINTTFFPRRDIVEVPLNAAVANIKSRIIHTSKDGTKGYALLSYGKGDHLARPSGFFSDCMPVSGEYFESLDLL
jgi:alpha-mannosidase